MTKEQLLHALSIVKPLLDQADPDWRVFGSAAAYLSGASQRKPHDLDIQLSLEGAILAEQLLAPYRLDKEQPESGKYRSRRSHYEVEGIEIDLSGGLERLTPEGKWVKVEA